MNPSIQFKTTILLPLIPLALVCFALSPMAQAQLSPVPDGGYAGGNTAEGNFALFSLTTGSDNTATGFDALAGNTTGAQNTANGGFALFSNTTGGSNTAIGLQALSNNTTGGSNTAIGDDALTSNITGSENTATGLGALSVNLTGNNNTGSGVATLQNNLFGNNNIAFGYFAGFNTAGDNNIDIGNQGVTGESNTIRIGNQVATSFGGITFPAHTNAYIAGIYQTTVAKGLMVVVDSTGHLGTKGSSERFKDEIKPMDQMSEAILALKPVTFHYKSDDTGTPQFGLIAEEVAEVNPDLVVRDENGQIYTVRYDAVNAMLLNEFLKAHRKIEQLTKDFAAKFAEQQKQIRALATGLEKVNNQLELSKPAPQTVGNNR